MSKQPKPNDDDDDDDNKKELSAFSFSKIRIARNSYPPLTPETKEKSKAKAKAKTQRASLPRTQIVRRIKGGEGGENSEQVKKTMIDDLMM